MKIAYSRIFKMLGGFKGLKSPLKPRFSIDPVVPGQIVFDDGVVAPEKAVQKLGQKPGKPKASKAA